MNAGTRETRDQLFAGRRVAVVGKLAGMPRRQVEQLIRAAGGSLAPVVDVSTELILVGDDGNVADAMSAVTAALDDAALQAMHAGRCEILGESELWSRLGFVDAGPDVQRLYTPVMLAQLVGVPVAAVRHWHRQGRLNAEHNVGRLPYFNFQEVRVARRLAELLAAGCSLSQIDRRLDELARLRPSATPPLADEAVVVVGRRLYVRRGEQLTEPSGQLLIDFDQPNASANEEFNSAAATIPIHAGRGTVDEALQSDDLRSLADEFEAGGEPERAIEVYRAILMSGDFTAEDHFSLAELLYRSGDYAAARERYYAAIELDEDYVEARANLGCLLAEQGELALAEAAFRGALAYHPDFADAHFHLARLLDGQGQSSNASRHWQRFLELAPASPWAEEALERTGATNSS